MVISTSKFVAILVNDCILHLYIAHSEYKILKVLLFGKLKSKIIIFYQRNNFEPTTYVFFNYYFYAIKA